MDQLRTLVALPDPGWIPSIHITAHRPLRLQSRGIQCPLLASEGTKHTHGIKTGKTLIHKTMNKNF